MPRVSIILPTYNAARFLPASIESALSQTFGDFELLVLDNASTDETPQFVSNIRHARVRYHRNKENVGITRNLALGLSLAEGEYVAQLGADDVWSSDFLRRTVEILQRNPSLSFVHSDVFWIDAEGRAFRESAAAWPEVTPGSQAFVRCFRDGFCFSAMLMRNSSIRAAGGIDPEWSDCSDLGLFLRLCLQGDSGFIREPLGWYRVHGQMSSGAYQDGTFHMEMEMLENVLRSAAAGHLRQNEIRELARREIALRGITTLHGAGSARASFRQAAELVRFHPVVASRPELYARVGMAMLPKRFIKALQRRRREKGLQKYAAFSPRPNEPSR